MTEDTPKKREVVKLPSNDTTPEVVPPKTAEGLATVANLATAAADNTGSSAKAEADPNPVGKRRSNLRGKMCKKDRRKKRKAERRRR